MPEVTVTKDDDTNAPENDIGLAGKITYMRSVPKATTPQRPSQEKLRFRVL